MSGMANPDSKRRSGLYHWLFELDRILRGEATRPSDIQQSDIKIPVVGIAIVVIVLAMIYGFCMGIFALVRGVENSQYQQALLQTFASMCKVPLLFGLTLVITFPSLYVFNALVGSQLRIGPVLKLLIASLAVNLAVLASMGPILAFFSVSTPNYPFIVILNVIVFTVAGVLGLVFLIQTLNRLTIVGHARTAQQDADPTRLEKRDHRLASHAPVTDPKTAGRAETEIVEQAELVSRSPPTQHPHHPATAVSTQRPGPLDRLDGNVLGHVRLVFSCWIIVFGLVGAQMGWVLRPFIGSPNSPFSWFRARDSNFFESVFQTLQQLLS